nr:PREDICTED: LOW QUALITY PROTEIN: talanin-like [Equus przewalskii]
MLKPFVLSRLEWLLIPRTPPHVCVNWGSASTKSTHLKKPLMEVYPWKGHLASQPSHPVERKTQAWHWQPDSSPDPETT